MSADDLSLIDLALYLAYLQWQRERRQKHGPGSEPSPGARALWLKNKALPQARGLLVAAAGNLSDAADSDAELLVHAALIKGIEQATTFRRGRPKKRIPLLDQARASVARRACLLENPSTRSEYARLWTAQILGLKLRKYMEETPDGGKNSTVQSAARRLRDAAKQESS